MDREYTESYQHLLIQNSVITQIQMDEQTQLTHSFKMHVAHFCFYTKKTLTRSTKFVIMHTYTINLCCPDLFPHSEAAGI
jgi:hypothetical protein